MVLRSIGSPLNWFATQADYRVYLTGHGSDTAGTYDFTFLLVVDSPSYWEVFRRSMQFNWEFAGMLDHAPSAYVSTCDTAEISRLLQLKEWTASSLYSFIRGLLVLGEVAPDRVVLPPIDGGAG